MVLKAIVMDVWLVIEFDQLVQQKELNLVYLLDIEMDHTLVMLEIVLVLVLGLL